MDVHTHTRWSKQADQAGASSDSEDADMFQVAIALPQAITNQQVC